jgi:probable F420-dependent oxidoreductase
MKELGRFGVWSSWFRMAGRDDCVAGFQLAEQLGFGTVWIPGRAGGDDFFDTLRLGLSETSSLVVASGIMNILAHPASDVAKFCSRIQEEFPGRFLLGLGASHANLFPGTYSKPLETMSRYLDELDKHEATGPDMRCLAALGPKMVELARTRSRGVHPYNVPLSHTIESRQALGSGPLLAPEQTVVIDEDPVAAFAKARSYIAHYDGYENYSKSWLRSGFTQEDIAHGGSDRLINGLVAWGDGEAVSRRLTEHLEAGADHVCAQIWTGGKEDDPRADWIKLASALGLAGASKPL